MGDVLGLGISHFPLLSAPDEHMSSILRYTMKDPAIAAELKDPAAWPEAMRAEWADEAAAAARHRDSVLRGMREVRAALDAFAPDAVIMWGDDQYENFKEDVIPPFCTLAYERFELRPWAKISAKSMAGRPNVWNESEATTMTVEGHRAAAKALVGGLLDEGFDMAYAYKALHFEGLAHAFLNAVLYLDYDRRGFPYPLIPIAINCYGRRVVAHHGTFGHFDPSKGEDPPSPSPSRCFDLGAAIARVCARLPYRIALVASSSWSHAFLVDKFSRLRPDVESDRRLYGFVTSGELGRWRESTLVEVEDAGQQEMLNWFCLMGAMHELDRRLRWSQFTETRVFTSNKVAVVFEPYLSAESRVPAAPARR